MYYWADAYSRQIKRGDRFGKLEKTISIAILDHELEELRGIEEIGVKWQIRDEITGKRILTDRLELIIIELPKARRMYKTNAYSRHYRNNWLKSRRNRKVEITVDIY